MSKEDYTPIEQSSSQRPPNPFFYSDATDKNRLTTTLSDLIDTMDIAMWELDLNHRIVGFNDKTGEIFGDDLTGHYCYRSTGNREQICRNCPAKMILNGHISGRTEQKRVDTSGNEIFIDHFATPIKDQNGTLKGVFVFSVDITHHKLLEKEVIRHRDGLEVMVRERTQALKDEQAEYRKLYEQSKRQEARYRSLIASSVDAIAIYGLDGRINYLNPSFTNTFGWQLEDFNDPNISFVPPEEKTATEQKIQRVVQDGEKEECFKTKRLSKDGRILEVDMSISRYMDHRDQPAGILVAVKDRTQSRVLERQFHQIQKMESIGTLAGGVAHDFNNILMGIQGRVSLLMSEIGSHLPYYEHVASIKEYIESATDLTKQLLGFARGGKYEVKTANVNEMIDKCLEMFGRTKKDIVIHKKYDAKLWTVGIDTQQIEQVLLNLYVNAMQAMPGGGALYLQTENVVIEEDHTKPFHVDTGRYVKISITDTGVGMDQSTIAQVFDPFFTTKEMGRGTGLGLASAYGIVKNHKGIITVYSEVGYGSTFSIYLPATLEKPDQEKSETQKILFGKETVLLLDDEKMVLDVGRPMLEKIGYTVFIADSGKEAIEIYKKGLTDIKLIIIDMIMPEMSGGEVYDELKKIDPDVKVLLSSGYSINGDAEEILARGCNGFIQKPFGMSTLSQKIRMVLDE